MVNEGSAVAHASSLNARWLALVKTTIARFSRGNIPAQHARILTPDEQKHEYARAKEISHKWRGRAKRSTAT